MSHHIVFLDRDSVKAQIRSPNFKHTYEEYSITSFNQIITRLQHATIAITNKVQLSEEMLVKLPRLRMVAVAATGYDCADISACRKHGVTVANIRNYAAHTVPEHVFMMVLALRRYVSTVITSCSNCSIPKRQVTVVALFIFLIL